MNDKEVDKLLTNWLDFKGLEKHYTTERRKIEDQIKTHFGVSDSLKNTETFEVNGLKLKISGRIDRKIDAELLQDIAVENGLNGYLSNLFRWKPEVNVKAWNESSEEITKPLSEAITTKPGRPSFSVTKNKESE